APPLRPPSAPAPGHAEHEAEHEEEPGRTALAPGGRRGAARAPAAGAGRPPRREASPAGDDPPGHEGAAEPSPGAPPPFADYRQGHEGGYPAGAAAHAALPADPSPRGPPPREGTGPPQGRGARLGSTPAPIGEEAAPEEAAPLSPAAEEVKQSRLTNAYNKAYKKLLWNTKENTKASRLIPGLQLCLPTGDLERRVQQWLDEQNR
ncbi:unnamed protein product, partial [Prorocentrum cordatum]